LKQSEMHLRYNSLQRLVYFLQGQLTPRSTRNYFDSIFKYLLFIGCDLTHEQLGVRVQFPRIAVKIPEGLDRVGINTVLYLAEYRFGLYLKALAGGGLREDEAAQLTPNHIEFGYNDDPARVLVTKEIAKFGIEHETFLPKNLGLEIQNYIITNNIQKDQTIFVKKYGRHTVSDLGHMFEKIRRKAGLETKSRNKFAKNDIRLHSLRAWFITTWIDLGLESFGRALAGHKRFLTIYYRKSPAERLAGYKQHQALFDF
jgi:integrase